MAAPMTDLDTGPSSIRDDSICESSLPPNKSSGDIVERLRFDAVRCELQFSKGVAQNIAESAAEIERLRREVAETRALLSLEIDRADLYANSVPVDVGFTDSQFDSVFRRSGPETKKTRSARS